MTKRDPVPAAASEPTSPALQPEMPQINLAARREELSEAHRECFKELHRLEGEIRGIDAILALLNPQAPPQPATNAEGDK